MYKYILSIHTYKSKYKTYTEKCTNHKQNTTTTTTTKCSTPTKCSEFRGESNGNSPACQKYNKMTQNTLNIGGAAA